MPPKTWTVQRITNRFAAAGSVGPAPCLPCVSSKHFRTFLRKRPALNSGVKSSVESTLIDSIQCVECSIWPLPPCLRFDEETKSLPWRNVHGSCSTSQRFADNKSANSTNWPPTILDTCFEGIGACPRPTIKAFSDLGDANEDSKLRRLLVTPGHTKVEGVRATRRAELEKVMADSGVKVGANGGRRTWSHRRNIVTCTRTRIGRWRKWRLWSPASRNAWNRRRNVRTCVALDRWNDGGNGVSDCSNHSVGEGAVLVTGLSDVAEDGRESWVGKPTDKLLLVERDGRGITKENKNSPAEDEPRRELRGTTVTKTTSNGKTFAHNQEKTLRYSNRKPSQPKFGQNKKKHYITRTPRHANKDSSTTQTQRRHIACACAEAAYRWTGTCPHAYEQW